MLDFIVRSLARMLCIWLPHSRGRHRAGPVPAPPAPALHVAASPRPPASAHHRAHATNAVPRTFAPPHPRPFGLEDRVRRRATRGLRERRRALYLASLGLDTEPPRPARRMAPAPWRERPDDEGRRPPRTATPPGPHVRPLPTRHRRPGPGPRAPRRHRPRLQRLRLHGMRPALPTADGRTGRAALTPCPCPCPRHARSRLLTRRLRAKGLSRTS